MVASVSSVQIYTPRSSNFEAIEQNPYSTLFTVPCKYYKINIVTVLPCATVCSPRSIRKGCPNLEPFVKGKGFLYKTAFQVKVVTLKGYILNATAMTGRPY